jgi:hypothetical protein
VIAVRVLPVLSLTPQRNWQRALACLVRGLANGVTIEMWVNKATKAIETAYPVGGL